MEKKTVVIKPNLKLYEIKEHAIFLCELEEEETINEYKLRLTFKRDETVSFYHKLVLLEKEYRKSSSIPLWLLIVFFVFAFGFFTAFLILWIIHKENLDLKMAFLTTILPALGFTGILGGLGIFRTKQTLDYIKTSSKRFEEYQKRVNQLISEGGGKDAETN